MTDTTDTTDATYTYTTTRKVYEAEHVPQRLRDKLCADEDVDAEWVTDCAVERFASEMAERGVELSHGKGDGPFWTTYPAGAALTASLVDIDKFLAGTDLADRHKRILRYIEAQTGVTARMKPGHRSETTVAETDLDNPHTEFCAFAKIRETADGWGVYGPVSGQVAAHERAEEAMTAFDAAWSEYVADVAGEFARHVEDDCEHLRSWTCIGERIADMNEGVTEDGEIVSLDECQKIGE